MHRSRPISAGLGANDRGGPAPHRAGIGRERPLHYPGGESGWRCPASAAAVLRLVLHLRITNTSETIPIYPLDPAFTRSVKVDDRPAMRLMIGKTILYGGAIPWPFGDRLKREYEEAQATDYEPLKPGESREMLSSPTRTRLSPRRSARKPDRSSRVQVRRGLIEYRGETCPSPPLSAWNSSRRRSRTWIESRQVTNVG